MRIAKFVEREGEIGSEGSFDLKCLEAVSCRKGKMDKQGVEPLSLRI